MKKLCPQFREMNPHGPHNYCCGGGSGYAIMSRNNIPEWRYKITGRKNWNKYSMRSQVAGARYTEVCLRAMFKLQGSITGFV